MNIPNSEIVSTEEVGMLNGSPVKLSRCRGGFVFATGIPKGTRSETALAAGSHSAVVLYNIESKFPDFQPAMMKSEMMNEKVVVEKHSHFLSDDLRKSGHDIYSIQMGPLVHFHITKHDLNISSVKSQVEKDTLRLADLKINKEFVRAFAGATLEKAASCGVLKVEVGQK